MILKSQKSFTLMELLVTVVIVSVLCTMALVSYNKTITRADVNDAIRQLTLIHAANQIYKIKHGHYWPVDLLEHYTADINTNLKLNLNTSTSTYGQFQCAYGQLFAHLPLSSYYCNFQTVHSPYFIFTVTDEPISHTNPWCSASCP